MFWDTLSGVLFQIRVGEVVVPKTIVLGTGFKPPIEIIFQPGIYVSTNLFESETTGLSHAEILTGGKLFNRAFISQIILLYS